MAVIEHAPDPIVQREVALEKANRVRIAHSRICLDIAAVPRVEGCRRVADMLEHPSEDVLTINVRKLLMAVDRVGVAKVRNLLVRADVRSDRRVSELSDRQRLVLAANVRRDVTAS